MRCSLCEEDATRWALVGMLKRRAWKRVERGGIVAPVIALCDRCFRRWGTRAARTTLAVYDPRTEVLKVIPMAKRIGAIDPMEVRQRHIGLDWNVRNDAEGEVYVGHIERRDIGDVDDDGD